MNTKRILITGASGYVGSRLVPRLLEENYSIRTISRSIDKLKSKWWSDEEEVELVEADALNYQSLQDACQECDAVFYLIHSMGQGSGDFEEADRKAARNMAQAADHHDLERIIYLGGIKPSSAPENTSKHRRSRLDVEKALNSESVPLTTFRAAMIIGAGSTSFEMLRYSLERLPPLFMTHTYVDDKTQPISISNVLTYLSESLKKTETKGETYDIGGPEVVTNREIMSTYCELNNLKSPTIISTNLIPISFVSYSTSLLTPLEYELIDPLVKGAQEPSVCSNNRVREIIPQDLLPLDRTIERASEKTLLDIETWDHDPSETPPEWPNPNDPPWSGGIHYEDRRSKKIKAEPEEVWNTIVRTGEKNGLFFAPWFRNFVGFIDSFIGLFQFPDEETPRSPLEPGDYLDCWVVHEIEKPNRIKLTADVKLPGKATYEFRLRRVNDEQTEILQIAQFRPYGIYGRIYWRILSLFHIFSFPLAIKSLANKSRQRAIKNKESA